MIIELYGLPGGGKSTLSKKLLAIDSSKFILIDFANRSERYFYLLLYIINHPINFCQWMTFLFQNKKLISYKLHLLSVSLAKMQKADNIKNKTALIDEGLVQRLLTVADEKISQKLLKKLLPYLKNVDYLIFVEGGNFYRFLEDHKKDNSPRVKLGKEYFKAWQDLLEENHKIIKEYLSNKKYTPIKEYNFKEDRVGDLANIF